MIAHSPHAHESLILFLHRLRFSHTIICYRAAAATSFLRSIMRNFFHIRYKHLKTVKFNESEWWTMIYTTCFSIWQYKPYSNQWIPCNALKAFFSRTSLFLVKQQIIKSIEAFKKWCRNRKGTGRVAPQGPQFGTPAPDRVNPKLPYLLGLNSDTNGMNGFLSMPLMHSMPSSQECRSCC